MWVIFLLRPVVFGFNDKFVFMAGLGIVDSDRPHATLLTIKRGGLPIVKRAHNANALSEWGPDAKRRVSVTPNRSKF